MLHQVSSTYRRDKNDSVSYQAYEKQYKQEPVDWTANLFPSDMFVDALHVMFNGIIFDTDRIVVIGDNVLSNIIWVKNKSVILQYTVASACRLRGPWYIFVCLISLCVGILFVTAAKYSVSKPCPESSRLIIFVSKEEA